MRAVFAKRFNHFKRDKVAFLTQLLLPALLFALGMVCAKVRPTNTEYPSLLLDPGKFKSSQVFFKYVCLVLSVPTNVEDYFSLFLETLNCLISPRRYSVNRELELYVCRAPMISGEKIM